MRQKSFVRLATAADMLMDRWGRMHNKTFYGCNLQTTVKIKLVFLARIRNTLFYS